ncbi:MAG TPA: FGGY family carbohydrate kinase, partial [Candidatus Limnocylindrales bacterium]|nr:FGGY family carbohydrate kinase [Candidatus Limnocylindrales bacterium]
MTQDILAIDVGTGAMKLGVFGPDLDQRAEARRAYEPHLYDRGKADIPPDRWWQALRECCADVRDQLTNVGVISLSVTTPALTPMAVDGTPLAPAVLFFDGRSHRQSAAIREAVGEERFLAGACNLPVSGGSSLSSILWFRDEEPETWERTAKFGHCNTYLVKRLTGQWTIDPSTTSITGLYNTAANDLTWNADVLREAGISPDLLPPLRQSYDPVGTILAGVARELGVPDDAVVLCGGNDATLAALSGGLIEPGDINIVSGTCDIASVCTDRPVASRDFNVRCHVIPGRWLTFFVLNAGGEGLDWFHRVLCSELDDEAFYGAYVPRVLEAFLSDPAVDDREADLPVFAPFLGGSRYAVERVMGSFGSLSLETTRDDLLVSLIRGNLEYLGGHLRDVAGLIEIGRKV